jgi:hypothetical protein
MSPIVQLLEDRGCDLDLDVLPVVAREVPDLPRPLKNWGSPWLVKEILAARDTREALDALDQRLELATTTTRQPTAETPPSEAPTGVARVPEAQHETSGQRLAEQAVRARDLYMPILRQDAQSVSDNALQGLADPEAPSAVEAPSDSPC